MDDAARAAVLAEQEAAMRQQLAHSNERKRPLDDGEGIEGGEGNYKVHCHASRRARSTTRTHDD